MRACGRPINSGGSCSSISFPTQGVEYTEICGRVIGYQFATTDAIGRTADINSYYIDGVSLTRGNPRQHVWTFMAGLKEDNSFAQGEYTCPCQTGSQQSDNIPPFVGNDYYCESGNPSIPSGYTRSLYPNDPLWDGEQCNGLESPCCNSAMLPWFHKVLDSPTDDYIEARVCADSSTNDEDVPIELLELYVK